MTQIPQQCINFDYPEHILNILTQLRAASFEAYIIGGAIRDIILKRSVTDFDITTNATPDDIETLFQQTLPTGKSFGTITVIINKNETQLTTYRSEHTYSNTRHPDNVHYETTIENDLARRDFTINALAYNPLTNQWLDQFNGLADLTNNTLRVIGNPKQRFQEDSLRLFRCCRFASQLNFNLTTPTLTSLKALAKTIKLPSKERIHSELEKCLHANHPQLGLDLLQQSGLGERILPGFNTIPKKTIEYCYKIPITIRWAFLLKSIINSQTFAALSFTKKEKKWIQSLIKHNLDPKKASLTIKDLKITSQTIQKMGFSGKDIGLIQNDLLNQITADINLNNTEILINIINQKYK